MISITLKDTLNKYGVSANQLATESKVRPTTIYNIINKEASSVSFRTSNAILNTLVRITGNKDLNITDIYIYEAE